jgi:hypothetical protein
VGHSKIDISGWTVTLFDADRWPAPQVSFSFPADTRIEPKELLILTDRSTTVGVGIKNFTLVPLSVGPLFSPTKPRGKSECCSKTILEMSATLSSQMSKPE